LRRHSKDLLRTSEPQIAGGRTSVAYYYIVEHLSALAASDVTYIPSAEAPAVGALLVSDAINPLGYLAMILILVGIAVLQLGTRPGKAGAA
jgi:drug/metabolite transporter (DMT)-like permease